MENQEIMVFENEQFGKMRTVQIDGEPWFVLKDVCMAFGDGNYRRVSERLEDYEKGVSQIDTPGGKQNMTIVNEGGVYSALFTMQPQKGRGVSDEYIADRQAKLKAFKHWVTHDVLPSIRKHGAYFTKEAAEKLMNDPSFMIRLFEEIRDEREKSSRLRESLTVAEANNAALTVVNENLSTTNRALTEEINTWEPRRITVALMKVYGVSARGGNCAMAYTDLYRGLESKYRIGLKIRKGQAKKNNPLLDYVHDDEWPLVVKVAAALCHSAGIDVGSIIGRENQKRLCA